MCEWVEGIICVNVCIHVSCVCVCECDMCFAYEWEVCFVAR